NKKKDAPSGTAKMLVSGMSVHKPLDEIQTVSLRSGSVVGEHQVSIQWNQESLTLTHQAQSKEVFAFGAIAAAQFLVQQPIGYYTMDDLF
ncbi:MAG TPA: 4-hydroxy-tetrahydrodipicolinate reductase, partial [Erysipelotrichaceae bacterium]|nr:4-hydroxy-tetrahydrodipicolinate reductase [Erysipelotrichaceae bacterium]